MQRAMFSDLYAFTMGAAYVQEGTGHHVVTCELFTRRLPRNRRFMVAAGQAGMLPWLRDWKLDEADVAYLAELPALKQAMTPAVKEAFLATRFTGDVWMMPEGTVFFPDEPVVRITAPILQAQFMETYLLSVFNHAASVASKAARVMLAAAGTPVVEFGMRRVHPDASLEASRVAAIMGLDATSNVAAGMQHGLKVTGTMAHAWVMVHDSEDAAFRAFCATYPKNATMLVDTYDTLEGVKRAIAIAGASLGAIRIDSGDLGQLAKGARALLDAAGMKHVRIILSGDLDEQKILLLRQQQAPVDLYAVGTELAASADAPTLGAVYKVTQDHARNVGVAKFAAGKGTLAGEHQVLRLMDAQGTMQRDVIALATESIPGATPLLTKVMEGGKIVGHVPSMEETRAYVASQLKALPAHLKDMTLGAPFEAFPVTLSEGVQAATQDARQRFAAQANAR